MVIPKEVKVGPFTYTVEFSEDVTHEGDSFGSTHNQHQKIFIKPSAPKQQQEQTFIHELLHACNFITGIVYRFDEKDKLPNEEEVVKATSMVLYQVIKDNPEIFK